MNRCIAILVVTPFLLVAGAAAQQTSPSPGPSISTVPAATRNPLPDTPQILGTGAERYRVTAIKGLVNPWGLAFLPNGDILVTEKPGRLRIIRNGVLDPMPLGGLPVVNTRAVNAGLMDVALHPRYAENQYIYFTYSKPSANLQREDVRWDGQTRLKANGLRDVVNATLARARYDGGATLTDVRDIFIADAESQGTSGSRIAFTKDGKIIMTVGMPTRHMYGTADDAQNGANHSGKVLRLNDDGTVPSDNPFVKTRGYRPEIFALGIRNAMGLFVHPDTGEIWETENGPMGGDEINVIKAGKNYGWPVVSYGVDYSGNQEGGLSGTLSSDRMRAGMEDPFYFWNPSPSVTGIIVYTGDKFPTWKGNIFVGAMTGDNLGGRMVHRLSLSRTGRPQSRGNLMILSELKQRIRDVRQSPDGLIYCATDEAAGAILKVEPVAEGEP